MSPKTNNRTYYRRLIERFRISLEPMTISHLELVFAWRQDRGIMQYLPSAPDSLSWGDHWKWWTQRGPNRVDWIINVEEIKVPTTPKRKVGVVHFDMDTREIGIIIGEKDVWGHGIAGSALGFAISEVSGLAWAIIHPHNVGSQRAFMKAGFKWVGITNRSRHGQEEWRIES